MKYALMKNEEHTLKMYNLLVVLEGVHKNVLPPFPITEFLKLNSTGICDM